MRRSSAAISANADPRFFDFQTGLLLTAALTGAAVHNFLGVALFSLLGCASILFRGADLRISPLFVHTIAIALVVCTMGLIPNTVSFPVRFEEMVRYSSYVLLAAWLSVITKRAVFIAMIALLAIICVTYVVYLTTGSFSVRADFGSGRRFASIFVHANHLAYVCAFISLATVLDILRGIPDRSVRGLIWANFLVSNFILVVSMSSGGLLALVAGSLIAAVTLGSASRKFLLLLIMGCALALIFVFTDAFELMMQKILLIDPYQISRHAVEYKFGGGKGSLSWRLTYWTALYDAHINSGAFHVLLGTGGGASSAGNYPYFFMLRDPHNDFMKMFVEYGIIGTSLIFLILLNLCRHRELYGLFAALCIAMSSGNTISSPAVMGMFFVCVSLYGPQSYLIRAPQAAPHTPREFEGLAR